MTSLCSATSLARQEPMVGTASRVDRWLLVEHPGPWGPPGLPLARMDRQLGAHLVSAAASQGARLLLIRRPKGAPCPPGRHVYLADSRPGREQQLLAHVPDDQALLALRLPAPASDAPTRPAPTPAGAGNPPLGWRRVADPLLLVCTHGRHDTCCAVKGRPVAAALSTLRPEQVWECSHSGGDRFAANVIVLPYGLYLGRVEPADAERLVAELMAGRVLPSYVRGRSSLTLPAQAAQQYARLATDRRRVADLLPVAQRATADDTWAVRLAGPGGPDLEVVVRYDRHSGERHLLTCHASEARHAPEFVQVSVTWVGRAVPA